MLWRVRGGSLFSPSEGSCMHPASIIVRGAAALALCTIVPLATAQALPARQLATAELRPLVLTTAQAQQASGLGGALRPGTPAEYKCGRQPDNHARYCSHIWDSPSAAAHPTISTVASFSSAKAARTQIVAETRNGTRAGTVVSSSATQVVYFVTGLPGIGTAAIAQQAMGSTYAYAWCSSATTEPTGPAVQCAKDLLAAQVTKARVASP